MKLMVDRWVPTAAPPRKIARLRRPPMQDHDLPILGQEENPRVSVDWEPLLATGVQPALILGAERRWHGRR